MAGLLSPVRKNSSAKSNPSNHLLRKASTISLGYFPCLPTVVAYAPAAQVSVHSLRPPHATNPRLFSWIDSLTLGPDLI